MHVIPYTLRKANDFVTAHHRHSKRTARDGGKFAIAIEDAGAVVGIAIVGNPVSATLMDGLTAEVLRTCTSPACPKNGNSMLYGACWRAWRAMGGLRLITYTLQEESGVSLVASGFRIVGQVKPHNRWDEKKNRDNLVREYQEIYSKPKYRWQLDMFAGEGSKESRGGSTAEGQGRSLPPAPTGT